MGGTKLRGGTRAVRRLRKILGVLLEVFVRRHNLASGMNKHAGIIHVAPLLLGNRGIGSVSSVAQRPDWVECTRIEGVANLQLRNVAAGDRGDNQRVGLRQANGIVGLETAAEVFLEQSIDSVEHTSSLAAHQDDL